MIELERIAHCSLFHYLGCISHRRDNIYFLVQYELCRTISCISQLLWFTFGGLSRDVFCWSLDLNLTNLFFFIVIKNRMPVIVIVALLTLNLSNLFMKFTKSNLCSLSSLLGFHHYLFQLCK